MSSDTSLEPEWLRGISGMSEKFPQSEKFSPGARLRQECHTQYGMPCGTSGTYQRVHQKERYLISTCGLGWAGLGWAGLVQ